MGESLQRRACFPIQPAIRRSDSAQRSLFLVNQRTVALISRSTRNIQWPAEKANHDLDSTSHPNWTDVESFKLVTLFIHDALGYHDQSSKKFRLSSYKEEHGRTKSFDELDYDKFLEQQKLNH